MTLDALCGEGPGSFCAPDTEAIKKTARGDPATVTDEMLWHSSALLCETALKVLSRDSQLRRAYVQRRWQGLIAQKAEPGRYRWQP
jgi:hypothetical protein